MSVAYSPCPNDTFMFHDVAIGKLRLPNREIEIHLHDVERLNRVALAATFDVTKLSFHTMLLVEDTYQLLSVGAAMGVDCGPVIVSKRDLSLTDLADCRVAIPGELTTAHLLLQLSQPTIGEKLFIRYDRVMDLVAAGEADAGVVIHEGRFTYAQAGLSLVADLGQWWQQRTDLPIPLGCIAARRSLGGETISQFEALLAASIKSALADPGPACEYAKTYAQEMDAAVLTQHVQAFVNEFSLDMGPQGRTAVDALRQLAAEAGVLT
jgi:1,4-dihydroxy-6-naphthoate synthase